MIAEMRCPESSPQQIPATGGMKTLGRPRVRFPVESVCQQCSVRFSRIRQNADRMKYCSRACVLVARPGKGRPRKLPPIQDVIALYVDRNLSITKIAKMFGLADHKPVRSALNRAGVKLRRKTVAQICRVEGCGDRAVKVKHAALKVEYGTLCQKHRYEHRLPLNRGGRRRRNNIDPTRYRPWRYKEKEQERQWLRENMVLLRQARLLSLGLGRLPDASQLLRKELSLVTTSLE